MVNQFIFSNPDVDFVLRDGGPNQEFDGVADDLFPEFGRAILGLNRDTFQSLGEERSIAEFDIRSVPDQLNGTITQATFDVRVSSTRIGGLGQGFDDVPTSISIYGYVGNGTADASDFQAGTLLDTLAIAGVMREDILSFDVTEFINTIVANNPSYAGFALRADDFGGIAVQELREFPQLRIQTDGTSNLLLLSNPEVDFQVIDGGSGGEFDGLGDNVFSTFNGVILGVPRETTLSDIGEERSFAEFDIQDFTVPDGEILTDARLEIQISDTQVSGLGQSDSTVPDTLSVYGYAGNGIADLADFDTANTFVSRLDSSAVNVGDTLSFNVTSFIKSLVNTESFAGFSIRADEPGGLSFSESSTVGGPRLVIETADAPFGGDSTVIVNQLLDEDDGDVSPGDLSLREALQIVEPGGSISFTPGLSLQDAGFGQGVLGLTLGALVIDRSVTINGLGAEQLTLDQRSDSSGNNGVPFSRVVLIDDNDANTQADVTINGLTLTGGALLAGDGSGILNREDLTIKESTISGNGYVFGSSARGAGIFNSGTLRVVNSLITGNSGVASYRQSYGSGLGIYNTGVAEVIGSEISNHNTGNGRGAGIANASSGVLTLSNSTLKENIFRNSGIGGGLANRGTAFVINSTIEQNVANTSSRYNVARGGGIDNIGTLELVRSTVTGNRVSSPGGETQTSGAGGGINNTGTLKINTSTISANQASKQGGGIRNSGLAEINNSSIVFNTRQGFSELNEGGGGLYSTDDATTKVVNSIIAGNIDDRGFRNIYTPDIFGPLDSTSAFNLVGNGSGSTIVNGSNGNQVGTTENSIDPKIGPLQDNGGQTLTHALLADSPAINAGNNAFISDGIITDQRGESRIVGGKVDIGAYESDVSDPGEPDTEPTVENPILDQLAQVAQTYRFELPEDVFDDADGDVLTTSASLENGQPLPNWLSFDEGTETLQGTPQDSDVGTVAIAITATDDDGNQITDVLDLTIETSEPSINEINGDDRNNRLDGTAVADLIRGFGGKDRIQGFNGNDEILGGAGNDVLGGNLGNDTIFGGIGRDRILGGQGDDELFGNEGRDRLFGDNGNDLLSGGDQNDSLNGGTGDDILKGGSGENQLRGGKGQDGFVLELGSGFSQIKDFKRGEDYILLPKGLGFGDLTIVQSGRKSQILVGDDLALEVFNTKVRNLDEGTFKEF